MRRRKLLVTVLALTMCLGMPMTANAQMIVKNDMSALETANTLNKNSSEIPKGPLQALASQFKIEYTEETLETLKKFFDADLYAKAYPDVARVYGNDKEALWNHYVTYGLKEGRAQIHNNFNVFAYISAYPDLQNAFGDDLLAYYMHYVNYGMKEKRKITTIEDAVKAGYTVRGMNGQVLNVPLVNSTPSNKEVSSSGSDARNYLPNLPQLTIESASSSSAPSKPTSPTKPGTPSKEDPKPNPKPDPGTKEDPGTCKHLEYRYEQIGDGQHSVLCNQCDEKLYSEDCEIVNGVCSKCEYEYKAEHEHIFDRMKQIEGTLTHGPVCTTCGYIDEGNAIACSADSNGYEITDDTHQKRCSECGGAMEVATPHEFTEWTENGEVSHKATCECGYEKTESHNFASRNGTCSVCGYKCTNHNWNNGVCGICGVEHENHQWNASSGRCYICQKEHSHVFTSRIQTGDTNYHMVKCSGCGYTKSEGHSLAGYNTSSTEHWQQCKLCGAEIGREAHNFSSSPTCKCGMSMSGM